MSTEVAVQLHAKNVCILQYYAKSHYILETVPRVLKSIFFVMKPEAQHITSVPENVLLWSTFGVFQCTQGKTLGYFFRVLKISTLVSPHESNYLPYAIAIAPGGNDVRCYCKL